MILLAGDGFVTANVLRHAVEGQSNIPQSVVLGEMQSNWPNEPFHDYAGVREAFGDEDELIAALPGAQVCFSHTYPSRRRLLPQAPICSSSRSAAAAPSTLILMQPRATV